MVLDAVMANDLVVLAADDVYGLVEAVDLVVDPVFLVAFGIFSETK